MNFTINKFLKTSILMFILQVGMTASIYSIVVTPVKQFTNSDFSEEIDVAADDDNNAFAVYSDSSAIYESYNQGGGLWPSGILFMNGSSGPHVAMDATGTALAISYDLFTAVYTAYYTGFSWITPTPDPLYTIVGDFLIIDDNITMDGTGKGLATYSTYDNVTADGNVYTNFFAAGTWSAATLIGTIPANPARKPVPAYSPNGNAAVVWVGDDSTVYANNFVGTWQGQTILDNLADTIPRADMGIDANGNAIAIWITLPVLTRQIATRRYDAVTLTWETAVIFSGSDDTNAPPKIAVASTGTAVAIWRDDSNNLQMNLFDGANWGSSTLVANNAGSAFAISMDNANNALIGWYDLSTDQIKAVLLPAGGSLGTPIVIAADPNSIPSISVALSDFANTGFIVWVSQVGEGTLNTFGSSILFNVELPTPPLDFAGTVVGGECTPPIDFVNVLTWEPSADPGVVFYYLRRNGVLIAIFPETGGPYTYSDYGRCSQSTLYSLTAVNAEGFESDPVTVTLP